MKRASITFEMVVAFAALIAILLGIGWLGLSRMAMMNGNVQEMRDKCWPKLELAREALRYSTRNSRITMQIFFLDDRKVIAPLLAQRATNTEKISELIGQIEAVLETDTERALLTNVWATRTPYVEGYKQALNLLLVAGQPEAARKMMTEVVTPNLFAYHQAWEEFTVHEGERLKQAGDQAEAYYLAARRRLIFFLALGLGLAGAIAIYIIRSAAREITRRRQAEEHLRKAHATLERRVEERTGELQQFMRLHQAILNSAAYGIHGIDSAGRIVFENPAAVRMLGWEVADLIGKPAHGMMHHTRADGTAYPAEECRIYAALRDGRINHVANEVFWRKDGSSFPVEYSVAPLRGERDEITGAVVVFGDLTEQKRAEAEIEAMHKQLQENARLAGMAMVATNVLHNVGNVLNSVNVAAHQVSESVKKLNPPSLARVTALLREHTHDWPEFLAHDPQGKTLPDYLNALARHLADPQQEILEELGSLEMNVDHIRQIVSMQQAYARSASVLETVALTNVIEDALRLNAAAFARHHLKVIRDYASVPPFPLDKHNVLQILTNLLSNAKYALAGKGGNKRLIVSLGLHGDKSVQISVRDNGMGIAPENLIRIFQHGFTTRKDGHGFGLHSGALAAQTMGGELTAQSDGLGKGSVFTLVLPMLDHPTPL